MESRKEGIRAEDIEEGHHVSLRLIMAKRLEFESLVMNQPQNVEVKLAKDCNLSL